MKGRGSAFKRSERPKFERETAALGVESKKSSVRDETSQDASQRRADPNHILTIAEFEEMRGQRSENSYDEAKLPFGP